MSEKLDEARRKARLKLCAQIREINDFNRKKLETKLGKILALKKQKAKNVDARDSHTIFYVDLHQGTHHFPHCTRYLLDHMAKIRSECTYLEMAYDRGNDWNRLVIYLFWHEFINDITGTQSRFSDMRGQEDFSGVQELIAEMNSKNEQIIKQNLDDMLTKKKTSMLQINDELRITLQKYTFKNHFTRQEYRDYCCYLRDKYPFVEMHHDKGQGVILRVWWQIYLNPMDSGNVELEEEPYGARGRRFWSRRGRNSREVVLSSSAPSAPPPSQGMWAPEPDNPPKKNNKNRFQSFRRAASDMARDMLMPSDKQKAHSDSTVQYSSGGGNTMISTATTPPSPYYSYPQMMPNAPPQSPGPGLQMASGYHPSQHNYYPQQQQQPPQLVAAGSPLVTPGGGGYGYVQPNGYPTPQQPPSYPLQPGYGQVNMSSGLQVGPAGKAQVTISASHQGDLPPSDISYPSLEKVANDHEDDSDNSDDDKEKLLVNNEKKKKPRKKHRGRKH